MVKQGNNVELRRSKRTKRQTQILNTSENPKGRPKKNNPVKPNTSQPTPECSAAPHKEKAACSEGFVKYGKNGIRTDAIDGPHNVFDVAKHNPFSVSEDIDDVAVFGPEGIQPIFHAGQGLPTSCTFFPPPHY